MLFVLHSGSIPLCLLVVTGWLSFVNGGAYLEEGLEETMVDDTSVLLKPKPLMLKCNLVFNKLTPTGFRLAISNSCKSKNENSTHPYRCLNRSFLK